MTAHPLRLAGSGASAVGWNWLAPAVNWLTPAVRMAASASDDVRLQPDSTTPGWPCLPRVATRVPSRDARSVRAARDFTAATLQHWGAAQRLEDIVIVVSELLTNALRYAPPSPAEGRSRWPVRLGLLQLGSSVMCAVADPSDQAPAPKEPGHLAESGRGLHVIGALADSWGCTPASERGKVVWALFSAPCSRPAPARPSLS